MILVVGLEPVDDEHFPAWTAALEHGRVELCHELVELRRDHDGQARVVLRHVDTSLEVSRRCVAHVREAIRRL